VWENGILATESIVIATFGKVATVRSGIMPGALTCDNILFEKLVQWSTLTLENNEKVGSKKQIRTSRTWASEGFFRGGALGDFSNIFPWGGQKLWNFVYRWKLRNQPWFAEIFQIQGHLAPLPPSNAHGHVSISNSTFLAKIVFTLWCWASVTSWQTCTKKIKSAFSISLAGQAFYSQYII